MAIAAKSTVPVVADIHFQWKYAMAALEAGIQGLRINPGNIKYQDKVRLIAREAKARSVPIRIGVNAGSLEKDLLAKYGRPTPEALVESALNEARILEDEDFFDIKISVKHSNPRVMIEAYRQLAAACDYPLHLGRDRGRPHADGRREVRGGHRRAARRGHRRHDPRLPHRRSRRGGQGRATRSCNRSGFASAASTSWPARRAAARRSTCSSSRSRVNAAIEREKFTVPMRVAVMGCVVNGPGEAREADVGIASGNGLGFILRQGEVVAKVPEDELVDALLVEARKVAAREGRRARRRLEGRSTSQRRAPPILASYEGEDDLAAVGGGAPIGRRGSGDRRDRGRVGPTPVAVPGSYLPRLSRRQRVEHGRLADCP